MASLCQVCKSQPSKYKCPACQISSCSLACSQAHKSNCTLAPAPEASNVLTEPSANGGADQAPPTTAALTPTTPTAPQSGDFTHLKSSPELQALFSRFPNLRSQLREIYNLTLEEEWEEMKPHSSHSGRGRGRGGGFGARGREKSRGYWTEGKGFNRGLGRVRRWREIWEEGFGGNDGDGFMQFAALIQADDEHDRPEPNGQQNEK
ncbi:hypothetical protein AJ80_03757 [Polytolypa hystricis UAMH7299]|uniref:HIT-type domain-containing protein n=1 Tax=Polytolypa hystricis (strain UAMH7299) TaxID=1447883 RepID=A0A2B7YF73_POLH7|nr:hypothetical protein AJ80_03757 [Polytolypa hystricis UAMH7299]